MKSRSLVFIFLGFVVLSGCQSVIPRFCESESFPSFLSEYCKPYVPFTDEHREIFEDQLERIQFYTSRQIVLRRIEVGKDYIDEARGLHIKGDKIIEITIPKYTPCIVSARNVSFEADTRDDDILYIQCEPSSEGKEYVIPFTRKERRGQVSSDPSVYLYEFRKKELIYAGEKYEVLFQETYIPVSEKDNSLYIHDIEEERNTNHIKKMLYPLLMIDLAEYRIKEEEKRIVPGIRIGGQERRPSQ